MITGINNIKEYIPQREPVIMIDTIERVSDSVGVISLTIRPDNIFLENGSFRESGLIEHVAQSAAAGLGYRYKQQDKPVPLGFIAAIKNFSINKLPAAGDKITTTVTTVNQVLDMTIVQSETKLNDKVIIASGEIRIFTDEK